MRASRLLAAVAAAGALLAVGGAAYASIPDGGGVIHACYTRNTGVLRLSDTGACSSKETSLSWNNVGPAGLTWQGQWSPGSSCHPRDAVVYQGSSDPRRFASVGSTPPSGNWMLLAAGGAKGDTGSVGPVGPAGPVGTCWPHRGDRATGRGRPDRTGGPDRSLCRLHRPAR